MNQTQRLALSMVLTLLLVGGEVEAQCDQQLIIKFDDLSEKINQSKNISIWPILLKKLEETKLKFDISDCIGAGRTLLEANDIYEIILKQNAYPSYKSPY